MAEVEDKINRLRRTMLLGDVKMDLPLKHGGDRIDESSGAEIVFFGDNLRKNYTSRLVKEIGSNVCGSCDLTSNSNLHCTRPCLPYTRFEGTYCTSNQIEAVITTDRGKLPRVYWETLAGRIPCKPTFSSKKT